MSDETNLNVRVVRENKPNNDKIEINKDTENIEIDILQNLIPLVELKESNYISETDFDNLITRTDERTLDKFKIINGLKSRDLIRKYKKIKGKADKSISNLTYNELQYLLKVDLYKDKNDDNEIPIVKYKHPFENYIRNMGRYERYIESENKKEDNSTGYKLPNISVSKLEGYQIYSNLKAIMDTKRISQTLLSEITGISRGTIITILKNPESISLRNAYKIAKMVGETIEILFPFLENEQ